MACWTSTSRTMRWRTTSITTRAMAQFKEEALERNMALGEGGQGVSSMGPDAGDVDRDGWLDLYIPDMDYGCLLVNRQDYFEDKTTRAGLAVMCGQYVGWGGLLFDYDNDGYLDVYVANGDAHKEFGEEDTLARNDGAGEFPGRCRRVRVRTSRKNSSAAAPPAATTTTTETWTCWSIT